MNLTINGTEIELTGLQEEQLRASGWLKLTREQWQQAFDSTELSSAHGRIRPLRPEHTDRVMERALAVLNEEPPDAA